MKILSAGLEIFNQTDRLDLAEALNPGYTFAPQNGKDSTDAMEVECDGGRTEKRRTKCE